MSWYVPRMGHHLPSRDAVFFNTWGQGHLPDRLGFTITEVSEGRVLAQVTVTKHHLAPNGYLHAGSIVALADSAAGYGCYSHLPPGSTSFTTIELKSNFMGTTTEGLVTCEATALHLGRTTHVWDATVRRAGSDKPLALFRCTQLILWPSPPGPTA